LIRDEDRMYFVFNCIVTEHDFRLVGLAAVICALASFTAISLLHHVRRSGAHMRRAWLAVSAISTGFGIWATHFIAMLAFSPGIPTAYNIALTGLSLIAAIFLTGAGLAVAVESIAGTGAWLGGAMVGGDIAAMHYTGMAAFEIPGRIIWDPDLSGSVNCTGRAHWRRRTADRIARGLSEMENLWRVIVDCGDLQSPLHRDGRRRDHPRSGD
jgi:NO-binding membrane sensor protein with MHYT domain